VMRVIVESHWAFSFLVLSPSSVPELGYAGEKAQ
jgi:hypothetical protein